MDSRQSAGRQRQLPHRKPALPAHLHQMRTFRHTRTCSSEVIDECVMHLIGHGSFHIPRISDSSGIRNSSYTEQEASSIAICTCCIWEPRILVRHCGPQQVNHNSGEVDVDNHHNIKLSEELQLQQIAGCLPICLRKQAPMSAWSCELCFSIFG